MDQQKWQKINAIVDTALELDKEQRSKFIKKQCSGDQDLRSQVITLLKAIELSNTEDFLENTDTVISQLAHEITLNKGKEYASSLIGTTIDKYKVTELIGHGGMGSVFLTERADEAYDRQVALKIMRRGMDTPSNIARFKRERNILARLNHPNIARLLDGGVTADGLPYLVMEYVNGTPLLEYCNQHRLSVKERLTLFKSICDAVQHAHRNAIIHRDLKPSNIFITNSGTVKVLDFGIAKLIDTHTSDASLFQTQTGSRILTCRYAAPEQFKNNSITTSTDSYTLGILLYEMLAGIHPFDMDNEDLTTIENLIRNQTPAKPSRKFKSLPESQQKELAQQRATTPSALVQTLRGDLDAMVMKALRKEPVARYNSVDLLIEDLDRHHQSRPLIAQSDTIRYRARKFLRRNRNVAIGTLVTLLTIIGLTTYHINKISAERSIAETEAQKAETVKNFLVNIFGSSNPQSTNFQGANLSGRELLINGKNRINQELANQPDVYTEILIAIGDAFKGIGAFEEAEKSYNQALSQSPNTINSLQNNLRIYVKLGHLKSTWKKDKKALEPALEAQKLLKNIQNPPSALEASVFGLLGRVNVLVENYEQANSYYERADSTYINAGMKNDFDYIQMLSGYGKSLIYSSELNRAIQVLQQSNTLHQEALSKSTLTIAENYKFLGWAHRDLGNFKKSNSYFLKSIDLYSSLIGKENVSTAASMYHLSINYTLSAEYEEAEKLAKEVLSIYQKLLDSSNDHIQRPKKYIAIAQYHQNQFSKAEQLLKELIQKRTKHRGENNIGLAEPYSHLAVIHQQNGEYKKAISLLEKAIKIYKKELGEYNTRMARAKIKLASVYRDMGSYEQARKYFEQVESIHQNVVPDNNHQQADFYLEYGKFKQETEDHQEAQEYFQKAYRINLDNFGKESKRTQKVQSLLGKARQA